MIKISHRGNVNGREPARENSPEFIDEAIHKGYDVEIDVRWKNGFYLGHDTPDYAITKDWLLDRKNSLWVHAKNIGALKAILNTNLRFFFHEKERHTIICNANAIWTHDLTESSCSSIIPLLSLEETMMAQRFPIVKGVCTDYPDLL